MLVIVLVALLVGMCGAETLDYRNYSEATVLVPDWVDEGMDTYVCMFDMQSGMAPRCLFRDDAVRYADAYFRQAEDTQLMEENASLRARLDAIDQVGRDHDKYIFYPLVVWALFGVGTLIGIWATRESS